MPSRSQIGLQEVYDACPGAGGSLGPTRATVRQGVTYWLGVGSNNPAIGGAYVVSWFLRRPPPPPNDDFARALEIFGRNGATQGENANASKEPGEPAHAGEPGGRSLWFRWRAPESGRAAFNTYGSEGAADTVLAVYTGSSVGALTPIASDADSGRDNRSSRLTFTATAGVVYHIAIDTVGGRETAIDHAHDCAVCEMWLRWNTGPGPANDGFASARTVSGHTGFLWAENVGARAELSEPSHADDPNLPYNLRGGASVWYRWTAPATGDAVFDAGSEDFDPLIAVYRGSTVGDLELVAENVTRHLESSGIHRGVTWEATAGQTYHVAVDAEFEMTGHYMLSWSSRPPNDDFANPRVLAGKAGTITDSNSKASRQDLAGEPDHEGVNGDASVWYAWTPQVGGAAVVDTLGTEGEVRLAVYTGSTLTNLQPIATTDYMGSWRRVQFTAVAGTTYRIAVDSPLFGIGYFLNWRVGAAEATAPLVTLTSPADDSRHRGLIPLAATASDASGIARVYFLVDGIPICMDDTAPYSCSWSTNFYGADRRSEFSARAVDNYRNEATTASVTALGDSGPPEMSWDGHTTDPSFSSTASFSLAHPEDPQLGFECSFEDAPFEPCDLPDVHTGLSAGGHWWRGRTTDVFGNTNSAPATVLWEVIGPDTAKPNGNVAINAGAAATNKVTTALRLHAWDADSSITHVRVSNVPTTSGGLLSKALTTGYASPLAWDLTATAYGGTANDGLKTVYVQYRDGAGNWSPVFSDTIRLDRVKPVATGPVASILAARQLGASSFWARVRWTGSDDASGVARYELQRSRDGAAWTPTTLPNVMAGQVDVILGYGPRYQFRARAIDRAGNAGAWVNGPTVTPALVEETSTGIAWSTGWTRTALAGASGGFVRASSVIGAKATLTFTGRGVALVAAVAPGRGTARVYSGSTLVATIDLDRPLTPRAVVFAWTWSAVAPRTIRVVVVGDGRVDVDAFVILR